ncbi:hypothetical protein [Roseimaritima ulvae]|uniref:Uncharacterized protein n=1 Tax=Roseimaritima ulvae TaxID=980254 RepID=A0A5B9QMD0_9BACT|nr:hypothetical protein [Roseimaritima ulvae]QEG38780.1 hypothetical protein UC8_07380 [Roseimaritima ulvae]
MAARPPRNPHNANSTKSSKSSKSSKSTEGTEGTKNILDLHSTPAGHDGSSAKPVSKPFLGVLFRCCNQYARIYRRADLTAYEGKCPRCGKRLRVPIGSGGTGMRFFGTQ